MGETYISVSVPQLAAAAVTVRNQGNDLHDLGMSVAGLWSSLAGEAVTLPATTIRCGGDLVAAAQLAERAHRSMLAECHVRLQQVSNGMAHAADAYARHETHESRVILEAV